MSAFGDELPAGSELCGGAYTIEKYLNSGGFGITYLARDSLGRGVVIKECFPSAMCYRANHTVRLRSRNTDTEFETILELFEKEAKALSELNHPYVVGVHQIFHDNNTAYMAIDHIDGRDLLQVIEEDQGRIDPLAVQELLLRCLEAVAYIHSVDVLHRDISPDNILLDQDGFPVFIDFGAARESATRVSRVLSKVLTVKDGYSPQEFYLQGSQQVYSSDLYALAATFYHLITGVAPPSSHTRMAAVAADQPDPFVPLTRSGVDGYADHFLAAINTNLELFPDNRMASAEVWRDAIDLERRQQILLEEAEEDRDLEAKVHQLVAEFEQSLSGEESNSVPATPVSAPSADTAKPAPPKRRRRMAPIVLEEPLNALGGPSPHRGSSAAGLSVSEPASVPDVPPEPKASVDALAEPKAGVLKPPPAKVKSRGLRRLFTGTKELIMGPSKARYE